MHIYLYPANWVRALRICLEFFPGIWDLGSGSWDLGSGIWDPCDRVKVGFGHLDFFWSFFLGGDLGSGIRDLGAGIWDLGSM